MRYHLFLILFFTFFSSFLFAQQDTAKSKIIIAPLFKDSNNVKRKDSTKKAIADTTKVAAKPKHDPRIATFRSAVLPGWGQIYNREYWKLPIVYGALAIPASLYVYNNSFYKKMKFAYIAVYDSKYLGDTSLLSKISSKVKTNDGKLLDISTYQSYRNQFKQNKDYCLIYFLLIWGVNVADATVFGHLKGFDVSDDLTMKINPSYMPTTKTAGIGLVFNFKNPVRKPLPSL